MMHVSPGLSRKLFGSQCSNNGQVNEDSEDDDQATDLNAFGSRHKGIDTFRCRPILLTAHFTTSEPFSTNDRPIQCARTGHF